MSILQTASFAWSVAGILLVFCLLLAGVVGRALIHQHRQLLSQQAGLARLHQYFERSMTACQDNEARAEDIERTLKTLTQRQDFLEAAKNDGSRIDSAISLVRRNGGDPALLRCMGLNSGEASLLMRMQSRDEAQAAVPRQLGTLQAKLAAAGAVQSGADG